MHKKIPFLTAFIVLILAVGVVYAAVVIQSEGTLVGPTDKLNLIGPTVTESGKVTSVDITDLTDLTVDAEIYADDEVSVDNSIYLTGKGGMERPIFLRQPDGGCSSCGVDAAGTTFSCIDSKCPAGMTQ